EGTLTAEHLARWTGRKDADGRIESTFKLAFESDSAGPRTVGGTVDALGGVGGIRVPAFHAALTPVDGEIQLDTVLLRSNVAAMDGGGGVQLRPGAAPGTLRLVAILGDLGPVSALMSADTVGADSARVNLTVTGPAWRWQVASNADAYGLAFAGNLANRITL